jgi:hypothetical protein
VVSGDGRVELELVPSLRFRFVIPSTRVLADVTGPGALRIENLGVTVPVHTTNSSIGTSPVKGTIDTSSSGSVDELVEVRFFVANLPSFRGELLGGGSPRPNGSPSSYWAGRLSLTDSDWRITLDERQDIKDVHVRLKELGGFEVTHVGSLRRIGGQRFSDVEASERLNLLAGFLGLASGAWAPPVAAIGLNAAGDVVWREWRSRWTSPWISRINAFDRLKHDLGSAFAGYADTWSDPIWNEPLRIATQMYVEANGPITADSTIVLGQTMLELIAWVRFVEDIGTRTEREFDSVYASERLRELLSWIEISPTVPSSLVALSEEAPRRSWTDGPHAITEMRNSLAHPRRRRRLTTTPIHARIDLQELVLWYAELALLRLIDYQGEYSSRLGAKMTGVVEDVPWK